MNPGDTLEGRGQLLQHGRLIAQIDYHLTIPAEPHFVINPTGKLQFDYEDYLGGFILLRPDDAQEIALTEYTIELASKTKKPIRVERRYKEIRHQGEPRVSFWVKVVRA